MPKFKWEELEELRHKIVRLKQYYGETIMREKVIWSSFKDLEATFDKMIEEAHDD